MPELPDIVTYIAALESRIIDQRLIRVRVASTFLLRSAQPPIREVEGRIVRELRRIGKRIAIGMQNDLWLVLHLMIAGRLHWRPPQASLTGRNWRHSSGNNTAAFPSHRVRLDFSAS
jgi:formamidopyrimidine-DNA glycosylase